MLPTREQLEQWDRDHVWHPFTPMQAYAAEPPLIIERARRLLPHRPRRPGYLDGVSSLWCNVHGHRVPELDAAVREQLDARRPQHAAGPGQCAGHPAGPPAGRAGAAGPDARLLLRRRRHRGRGRPEDGVSVLAAVSRPAARARRSSSRCSGAYHGDTLGDVSVGDLARFHHLFAPLLFPTAARAEPLLLPLSARAGASDAAGSTASTRWPTWCAQHADELAAVVIEPLVQGAAGMITAPEGYLRRVREVTRRARRAAHRRRGGGRLRPHRHAVRLRAGRRDAGLPLPGQGADRRLPAAGGDADHRRGLQRVPRPAGGRAGRSTTATPTPATRWAPPSPWPASTCWTAPTGWPRCRRRSSGCAATWSGCATCRSSATCARRG